MMPWSLSRTKIESMSMCLPQNACARTMAADSSVRVGVQLIGIFQGNGRFQSRQCKIGLLTRGSLASDGDPDGSPGR